MLELLSRFCPRCSLGRRTQFLRQHTPRRYFHLGPYLPLCRFRFHAKTIHRPSVSDRPFAGGFRRPVPTSAQAAVPIWPAVDLGGNPRLVVGARWGGVRPCARLISWMGALKGTVAGPNPRPVAGSRPAARRFFQRMSRRPYDRIGSPYGTTTSATRSGTQRSVPGPRFLIRQWASRSRSAEYRARTSSASSPSSGTRSTRAITRPRAASTAPRGGATPGHGADSRHSNCTITDDGRPTLCHQVLLGSAEP